MKAHSIFLLLIAIPSVPVNPMASPSDGNGAFIPSFTKQASPSRGKEDKDFWMKNGQDELQKRLKIQQQQTMGGAKNIIIFVGDGMGIATVTAARILKGQEGGSPYGGEEAQLSWEQWPYTGLSKTYNTNYQVPDSAGTATAIFSGVKTSLSVLGIDNQPKFNSCDPELVEKSKLKNVLHMAMEYGKATGIVTNSRITHATPAALYANIQSRNWEHDNALPDEYKSRCLDIAHQLVYGETGSKINVLFGGGLRNFLQTKDQGKRTDKDLLKAWKEEKIKENKDFDVLLNNEDLKRWDHSDYVLGLFGESHIAYVSDRDPSAAGSPSLSEMTKAAVERLEKSKKGYFLMVENGQIDGAHHENNAYKSLYETLEFDNTVKMVMEMTNPEETLLIVTADHSHSFTITGYPKRGNPILGYIYDELTGNVMVQPDNSKAAYTTLSYANGPGFNAHYTGNAQRPWIDVRENNTIKAIHTDKEFLQSAMWPGPDGYEAHGGEDVAIYATGPMSHLLVGVHEQNYIAHVMYYAMKQWQEGKRVPSATMSSSANLIKPLFIQYKLIFSLLAIVMAANHSFSIEFI